MKFRHTYKYKERECQFDPDPEVELQQRKPSSHQVAFVAKGLHGNGKSREQVSEGDRLSVATLSNRISSGMTMVSSRTAWKVALLCTQSLAKTLDLRIMSDDLIDALKDKLRLSTSQLT